MTSYALQKFQEGKSRLFAAFHHLDRVTDDALTIQGWVANPAAREIAIRSFRLAGDPTIVEVGSFMGRSSALLAGARRLRGKGKVHAIDPFDCSGDDFSIPHYESELQGSGARTLEEAFRGHMRRLQLDPWVEVHKGTSFDVIGEWGRPIDLLLLDGDQTPSIARKTYELWIPFLKKRGQLIVNNAGERQYAEGHDGNYILANQEIVPPKFYAKCLIQHTLFANKK